MQFYSTNNISPKVDFKEATINGQAPDKGLYFPGSIPVVDKKLVRDIEGYSKEDIAFQVIQPYVGNTIPTIELKRIVEETVNFDIPLIEIGDDISTLELYHGPTLAFKDVGARFMSRCLGYFVKDIKQKVTVLVATSGDTGGAVANGFFNIEGVDVVILYPSGKVSNVQELQLTTLGGNVKALEVEGSFDDCQRMVKSAFADADINDRLFLTSANSINVARWLPQQFYYFFAFQQWKVKEHPPVISVPSGNFGNICAGLLAYASGLPVKHFIAACNANDLVRTVLEGAEYSAKKTVHTLSNAMDVGDPSNFVRILQLFNKNIPAVKKIMSACSISDDETKETIKHVYQQQGYTLDPHGAVGYKALRHYLAAHQDEAGFFLGTAHPIKFYEVVEQILGKTPELPMSIQQLVKKEKQSIRITASDNELKKYLLS